MNDRCRIIDITLDEKTLLRRGHDVEHERRVAIFDLLEENHFAPASAVLGPFRVHLSIEEGRLVFHIMDEAAQPLERVQLSLAAFRRIVKDYFHVCESYFQAIKTGSPSRIEAIDMGRRGLHDEGAQLLKDRLEGKIEIDGNTARRLFTLICVLHIKG